jgi:beta-lactamase class D
MYIRLLSICFFALLLSSCAKTRITEHPEWSKVYSGNGIDNACILLRDNNHESIHYYNKTRSITRFCPAATFNIFTSVVALEAAVASDDQLVIKWDGTPRNPDWDKDLTLADAFKVSSEPYFQELARRVGPAAMQHNLDTANYGNKLMSGRIDNFWLNNSLAISADEQTGLLKRLYFAELPYSERSQRIVKGMMLKEQTPTYNLYYQSARSLSGDTATYWIVGFIEKVIHMKEPEGSMNKTNERNYPYFFAQNFSRPSSDMTKDWNKAGLDMLRSVLKDYGAMPQ